MHKLPLGAAISFFRVYFLFFALCLLASGFSRLAQQCRLGH